MGTIRGTRDDETLYGTDGRDRILGLDGGDVLYGYAGEDILDGGAGDDFLSGGRRDDVLIGGLGNDYLFDRRGNNSFDGGDGIDVLSYDTIGRGFIYDAVAGTVTKSTGDIDTVTGIEVIFGSRGDDVMAGDTAIDEFHGGAGDDRLSGGANDDLLHGDAGDDLLDGGSGSDTASYAGVAAGITLNLSFGRAVDDGNGGEDRLTEIENIIGSAFGDWLVGDDNANVIDGGAGNDRISGGDGADQLRGGDGDDTILDGAGIDILTGGAGADRFVFTSDDLDAAVGDYDYADFHAAEGDRIDLSAIDAIAATDADEAFRFIGDAAFSAAAGELRVGTTVDGFTSLEGDTDGDGIADFAIRFLTAEPVVVSDLTL